MMNEIEIKIFEVLQAELQLAKAKQEYKNDYVFGYDDVVRIIHYKIESLKNERPAPNNKR